MQRADMLRPVPFKNMCVCGGEGGGGRNETFFEEEKDRILNYLTHEIRYDFWQEGGGGVEFLFIFRSSPTPHF